MVDPGIINEFLASKELAIAGVSRDKKKFGYIVFNELRKRDFSIFPVNPNTKEIDGMPCYNSISELPANASHLYIVTPKSSTEAIVKEAVSKGIRNIWIHQKSDTPEVLSLARDSGINLIHGECIIMYIKPVAGFHKFHRFLKNLFGGLKSKK